jgi:hypothetical protein
MDSPARAPLPPELAAWIGRLARAGLYALAGKLGYDVSNQAVVGFLDYLLVGVPLLTALAWSWWQDRRLLLTTPPKVDVKLEAKAGAATTCGTAGCACRQKGGA